MFTAKVWFNIKNKQNMGGYMKLAHKVFNIKALAVVSMIGISAVMVALMISLQPSKSQSNPATTNNLPTSKSSSHPG
jgi:hypothetical protein